MQAYIFMSGEKIGFRGLKKPSEISGNGVHQTSETSTNLPVARKVIEDVLPQGEGITALTLRARVAKHPDSTLIKEGELKQELDNMYKCGLLNKHLYDHPTSPLIMMQSNLVRAEDYAKTEDPAYTQN